MFISSIIMHKSQLKFTTPWKKVATSPFTCIRLDQKKKKRPISLKNGTGDSDNVKNKKDYKIVNLWIYLKFIFGKLAKTRILHFQYFNFLQNFQKTTLVVSEKHTNL